MNYSKLHKSLLFIALCVVAGIVIGAAFLFDIAFQVGAVVAILALLWVGWELHRLATLAKDFMEGFVEGYLESIHAKSD